MAVNRQENFLGQQRVDVPHLRSIESAICYDFDVLGLAITAGVPCVVSGFEVINYTNLVGSLASTITIKTASSRLIHPLASDSGSFFQVPANRSSETLNSGNSRLQGSWMPNTVNYLGVDLLRQADNSTVSNVKFLTTNPDTEANKRVPLARTMDYVLTISTTPFSVSPSICPLYIVQTNTDNTISSIKDARNLLFRNGIGGDAPNSNNPYGWPGTRNEATALNPLIAGDRSIKSLKQWLNAAMTRFQEIGGGEYWYSLTSDRNVKMCQTGAFVSDGEAFEWDGTNLHWKGLKFLFDNSTASINEVQDQLTDSSGLTNLLDGECLYVDLDRFIQHTVSGSNPLVAQKAVLATLGGSSIPGQRWVLATRNGNNIYIRDQSYPVGSSFSLATTSHSGTIKSNLDVSPLNPVAITMVPVGTALAGVAVTSGISRAKTQGTVVIPDGDILIGYGSAQGDHNVILRTSGNYGTKIVGNSTTQAYLSIVPGGAMGSDINPSSGSMPGKTPLDLVGDCSFDGNKSWNLRAISVMPLAPIILKGDVIPSIGNVKWFVKSNKTWKQNVRAQCVSGTWTYDNTAKTLTASDTSAAIFDGVTLGIGDRVLFNVNGAAYNGIYVVTNAGGSSAAVFTRAQDAGGPTSATVLGLGYDLFDGAAVKVSEGTISANTYYVLNAANKNDSVVIDGTKAFNFTLTDFMTADQYCVMFFDGSYVIIATGPTYEGF